MEDKPGKRKRCMLVWPTAAVITFLLGTMMLLRRIVKRLKGNQHLHMGKESSSPNLQVFSFAELKEATDNFLMNNRLGEGGYGPVYKCSGYVPPEYIKQGIYSRKYDVYSFGVILLQFISGKKCTHLNGATRNLNLLEHAYDLWKAGKGKELINPSLNDATLSCKV
ncbi:hypothetical protein POM88_003210 [Heracleum sosnowskyi]|uniref:Protein kinase domain-containing protein n=1 Tax=Heracleum sosnowskyi TaxID=360622 RepID=A0AAD8N6N1_9APIA|nr:hypothetical protein POM88_003210 [Heracleum sosnowskyi]